MPNSGKNPRDRRDPPVAIEIRRLLRNKLTRREGIAKFHEVYSIIVWCLLRHIYKHTSLDSEDLIGIWSEVVLAVQKMAEANGIDADDSQGTLLTLVMRIACNKVNNLFREIGRSHTVNVSDIGVFPEDPCGDPLERQELRAAIDDAIAKIKSPDREPLLLQWEILKHTHVLLSRAALVEIFNNIGLGPATENAIKGRLQRARAALRQYLKDKDLIPPEFMDEDEPPADEAPTNEAPTNADGTPTGDQRFDNDGGPANAER